MSELPKTIWMFMLPDGHWEIRFEKPDVPSTEYTQGIKNPASCDALYSIDRKDACPMCGVPKGEHG